MITDALRALKEKSRFFDTIWEVAVGWPCRDVGKESGTVSPTD